MIAARNVILSVSLLASAAAQAQAARPVAAPADKAIGRIDVRTLQMPTGDILRSATYTPSGKVLVSYARTADQNRRQLDVAVMNDDGSGFKSVWSGTLPDRPKDNGIRFMIFPDNKRVFLGDFILECSGSLDACGSPRVLPVDYPAEINDGPHVMHRWSEMVVAPDNRHVGWNTLFNGGIGVAVFTGLLERSGERYRIAKPQIVSTLQQFRQDPNHADGVLPEPMRGGEIKQFVHGGTALSLVGSVRRDIPDSVVQTLSNGRVEAITDVPGYDETTIFSPDERLGLTMTSRFSPNSDPAILGLMPRPYPSSLNMGLSMFAYTYAVTGVRAGRPGNVGPALISIAASKSQPDYTGINLNRDTDWVFSSPMSWHPGGRKGMWNETHQGDRIRRVQIVTLPDYRVGPKVPARPTPDSVPYGSSDLSGLARLGMPQDIDVKVYGRKSGYIQYRRSAGSIEKVYSNFSDDGHAIYSGREATTANPAGQSVYVADVQLGGAQTGVMKVQMTFGPLRGGRPAALSFVPDASGKPATRGFVEYAGRRLDAADLVP